MIFAFCRIWRNSRERFEMEEQSEFMIVGDSGKLTLTKWLPFDCLKGCQQTETNFNTSFSLPHLTESHQTLLESHLCPREEV